MLENKEGRYHNKPNHMNDPKIMVILIILHSKSLKETVLITIAEIWFLCVEVGLREQTGEDNTGTLL